MPDSRPLDRFRDLTPGVVGLVANELRLIDPAGNTLATVRRGDALRYAMGAPVAGDTVSGTTVETSFASAYAIPAGEMVAGRAYLVSAAGVYGTNAGGPTLTLRLRLGTTLLLEQVVSFSAVARTNRPWRLDAWVTVSAAGVAGAVEAQGSGRLFTGAGVAAEFELFNAAPVAIDTTVAQTLAVSARWNLTNAPITITQRQFVVLAF